MSTSDDNTAVTDITKPVEVPRRNDCLVVIYDPNQEEGATYRGKRVPLVDGTVNIGRRPDNDVILDRDGISRRHARIERTEHGCVLIDDGSTNGTLLNGERVRVPSVLRNRDRIQVGRVILTYLTGDDVEGLYHEAIFDMIDTDPLTGLGSRRNFDDKLAKEFTRSRRYGHDLSVVMLDIDRFKGINDTYGHAAGDAVLAELGKRIRASLREAEMVAARRGGEEFAIILPEASLAAAACFAEEVRRTVEKAPFAANEHSLRVTVSIGCAVLERDADPAAFCDRCDKKLYEAKHAGRNCVRA